MEQFITRIKTDLDGVLEMTQMFDGLMMTGDNLANRIIVELSRGGVPVSVPQEAYIVGYVIRNDGYTLDIRDPLAGVVTENGFRRAFIDIPDVAYYVPGPLSIAIRMVEGEHKTVIATSSCYVNETETNSIIDMTHKIPDVEELLSHLEELDALNAEMETAEGKRRNNEAQRSGNEQIRKDNETARANAESDRQRNEETRITNETRRQTDMAKFNNMTVHATKLEAYTDPTVQMSEINGHKHMEFGIPPGDPFVIQKTFASISAMNAYTGTDIRVGSFVCIASTVEDPDNAKMYVKTDSGYSFVTDLSGAQGIKGDKGEPGAGVVTSYDGSKAHLTVSYVR